MVVPVRWEQPWVSQWQQWQECRMKSSHGINSSTQQDHEAPGVPRDDDEALILFGERA